MAWTQHFYFLKERGFAKFFNSTNIIRIFMFNFIGRIIFTYLICNTVLLYWMTKKVCLIQGKAKPMHFCYTNQLKSKTMSPAVVHTSNSHGAFMQALALVNSMWNSSRDCSDLHLRLKTGRNSSDLRCCFCWESVFPAVCQQS